ncbi:uncharacterized protein [Ptychodera flava]|uniref:uncharacterized protein n=1 Tax=Ptychodera flava TaxID=63121 RepID=UPI00396A1556
MDSSPFQHVPHTPSLFGSVPMQSPAPTVPDVDFEARVSNIPSPFQRNTPVDQTLPQTPVPNNTRSLPLQGTNASSRNLGEQEVPENLVHQQSTPSSESTARCPRYPETDHIVGAAGSAVSHLEEQTNSERLRVHHARQHQVIASRPSPSQMQTLDLFSGDDYFD